MSTKALPPASDSTDEQTTEEIDYDALEEEILDELPERFRELSHLRRGRMGSVQMLLIPSRTWRDSEGELSSHVLMNSERNTLSEFGFEFKFATLVGKGVGVKFWFEQSDE